MSRSGTFKRVIVRFLSRSSQTTLIEFESAVILKEILKFTFLLT